eukprot:scaffold107329_cov30-Tisochrysis_lutea.AAC.1
MLQITPPNNVLREEELSPSYGSPGGCLFIAGVNAHASWPTAPLDNDVSGCRFLHLWRRSMAVGLVGAAQRRAMTKFDYAALSIMSDTTRPGNAKLPARFPASVLDEKTRELRILHPAIESIGKKGAILRMLHHLHGIFGDALSSSWTSLVRGDV